MTPFIYSFVSLSIHLFIQTFCLSCSKHFFLMKLCNFRKSINQKAYSLPSPLQGGKKTQNIHILFIAQNDNYKI